MSVQSTQELGKDFCPNFLQPFPENIDRSSCNDGSRELIPVFHNPHRKCQLSPSTVTPTVEYLVGVPLREEKQVRISFELPFNLMPNYTTTVLLWLLWCALHYRYSAYAVFLTIFIPLEGWRGTNTKGSVHKVAQGKRDAKELWEAPKSLSGRGTETTGQWTSNGRAKGEGIQRVSDD